MSLSERAIRTFFERPEKSAHRQYEALRAFLYEGRTARQVAARFGYSPSTVYTLVGNFRRLDDPGEHFLADRHSPGRSVCDPPQEFLQRIVELREARLSVPGIKARLDAEHPSAPSMRRTWRARGGTAGRCLRPLPTHCGLPAQPADWC